MIEGGERPFGIVLAGGQARRMGGGAKPLLTLPGGGPLIDDILARIAPQCSGMAISTGSRDPRWKAYPYPRIADAGTSSSGPLAGVLAALDWLEENRPEVRWLLSVPGDTPFLPRDLVLRLTAALHGGGAEIACADSEGRVHPVVALWSCQIREDLRRSLAAGEYRVRDFQSRFTVTTAVWDNEPVDPFFNINTPKDLKTAEELIRDHPSLRLSES